MVFLYLLTISLNITPTIYPGRDALTGALQERAAEGAVTAESALQRQLLNRDVLPCSGELPAAANEEVDAQTVDIDIVGNALTGEVLAKV